MGAQKGRRRLSAGSRGGAAAAGAETVEEDAENAADAGQAVAEGMAKARGRDAGSWLRAARPQMLGSIATLHS